MGKALQHDGINPTSRASPTGYGRDGAEGAARRGFGAHRRCQLVAPAEIGVDQLGAVEGQALQAQHAEVERGHDGEVERERVKPHAHRHLQLRQRLARYATRRLRCTRPTRREKTQQRRPFRSLSYTHQAPRTAW